VACHQEGRRTVEHFPAMARFNLIGTRNEAADTEPEAKARDESPGRKMTGDRIHRSALIGAAIFAVALLSACSIGVFDQKFERSLTVDGPVRLEVETGSGRIAVSRGAAGHVSIRGEVRLSGLFTLGDERRAKEVAANPPIEQIGNVIRLGKGRSGGPGSYAINYIIETPEDTRLEATTGSGKIEVKDIHGPAKLWNRSGLIEVENVGDDVTATTGSGGCRISRVQGHVNFTVKSGGATIEDVSDEIRGTAESGTLRIERPGGRVAVETKSGGITVRDAKADLRAFAGSGVLDIAGSPAAHSYWELQTGSGRIELDVPSSASFRLHARTESGKVSTDLPITIEEQTGKEIRARVGSGDARVEAHTSSGAIRIR
jgi:hypothetical protein